MRTLRLLALLSVFAASTVRAQPPQSVGIYADLAGTQSSVTVTPFVPFNFHVLAFDLPGQVKGWELSVQLDPAFAVLSTTLDQPLALNIGSVGNFIVGNGGCFDGAGTYRLVTYQAIYVAGPTPPTDEPVCLGPSSPSSFSPAAPGYLQCDNTLSPLAAAQSGSGLYPDGCMLINPVAICGPLPAVTDFALSSQVGNPGDLVTMPVLVGKSGYIDCLVSPFPIRRMHLEFTWDQAIATLESITPASFLPADWTISFSVTPDRALVDLQGPSSYEPSVYGVLEDFVTLGFRLLTEGVTPVGWLETSVFDAADTGGPAYPFADGSLETQSVPTSTNSFGQIKAAFGQ